MLGAHRLRKHIPTAVTLKNQSVNEARVPLRFITTLELDKKTSSGNTVERPLSALSKFLLFSRHHSDGRSNMSKSSKDSKPNEGLLCTRCKFQLGTIQRRDESICE
jgi:hypothetical protein